MINDMSLFPPQYHPVKPYAHQLRAFEETRELEFYALWWEMGTGKTKPIIDTATHLFLKGQIDGLLVVSDKGAYMNWIKTEVPKHMMPEITRRMGAWNSQAKKHEIDAANLLLKAVDNCLDIAVVNIESLSGGRGMDYARQFIRSHYTLMVIDESTSIKNVKAERTKVAIELGRMCDYRRILTGTPITQSPLDVFGQCEFLKQGLLGFKSFVAFRSMYARMVTVTMGPRCFNKIAGYQNLDLLTDSLKPFSSRLLKTDCLDLPPKVYETIEVEHHPVQAQMYRELKATAIVQLEQGLLTSTSALTTIVKLHQINCGHLRLDDGTEVDVPSCRVNVLLDLLERIGTKTIIWCAFQRDVELILKALHDGSQAPYYAVHYFGKTDSDARTRAIEDFQNNERCRWFIGTPATGGKGITLTAAHHVIYYSNTYNLEHRLQSEDRPHRIGQKNTVTYIDLVVPATVDSKIVAALKKKEDIANDVLGNLRAFLG